VGLGCAGQVDGGRPGDVFGRRRWRTPWSSRTSGDPWSPEAVRPTRVPTTAGSPWAQSSPAPAEPAAKASGQPTGPPTTTRVPAERPPGAPALSAVSTPTVKVIPSGSTAAANAGTAAGRAGPPGVPPASPPAPASPPGPAGSRGSADPPRARLIRIPAWSGVEHRGDAGADGGAGSTRRRSRPALAVREAPSLDVPSWEQAGDGAQGRIAPAVLAVVVICALLGGLSAFAVTRSGSTPVSPSPAASIAPAGESASGGAPAGTKVSGAGTKPVARGHGDSGRGDAAPAPTPTAGTARRVGRKPSATPSVAGRAGHRGDDRKPRRSPKRAVPHRQDRHPVGSAPDDSNGLGAR
jgi:hypothetical protein